MISRRKGYWKVGKMTEGDQEILTSNYKLNHEDIIYSISSVAQSCPTLWPQGLQHSKLPCPLSTPGVCSNSSPTHWWCHPIISSSVIPSPPTFNLSQHQGLFLWFSSSHQVAKVLGLQLLHQSFQRNIQDWFPLGCTGWISLLSKGLSRVFSNTTVQKRHSSVLSFLYGPTLTSIRDYWKNHSFD